MVHPGYYILQIFFFVYAGVAFGLFLHPLIAEITGNGWNLTPHALWLWCLCACSLSLLVANLDPYAALGIFPTSFAVFMSYFPTLLLLQAMACALYIYLIVIFRQTSTQIPKALRRAWMGINFAFIVVELVVLLLACASNNVFWLGVADSVVLASHVLLLVIGWNLNLAIIAQSLKTQVRPSTLSNDDSYRVAILKIWRLCFMGSTLGPLAVVYEMGVLDGSYERLLGWGDPLPFVDRVEFHEEIIFGSFLQCMALGMMYYALSRPQQPSSVPSRQRNTPPASETSVQRIA